MEYCLTESDLIKTVTDVLSDTNIRLNSFKEELEQTKQKVNSLEYLSRLSIIIGLVNFVGLLIMKK